MQRYSSLRWIVDGSWARCKVLYNQKPCTKVAQLVAVRHLNPFIGRDHQKFRLQGYKASKKSIKKLVIVKYSCVNVWESGVRLDCNRGGEMGFGRKSREQTHPSLYCVLRPESQSRMHWKVPSLQLFSKQATMIQNKVEGKREGAERRGLLCRPLTHTCNPKTVAL